MRPLRLMLFCGCVLAALICSSYGKASIEDNEFAEFDDFDDEEFDNAPVGEEDFGLNDDGEQVGDSSGKPSRTGQQTTNKDDDEFDSMVDVEDDEFFDSAEDAVVETEEEEFDPFADDEEFEHAEAGERGGASGGHRSAADSKGQAGGDKQDLRFATVPPSMRRWQAFYLEIMMGTGIMVYLINFLVGKSRNSTLAQTWFKANGDLLEQNFAVVGDDGTGEECTSDVLVKESDSSFMLWCTGRVSVQGMLCSLKLLKRQDLVSTIGRIVKPASDQLTIKIVMDNADMDNFVFAIALKKTAGRLHKEMADLSSFCADRKAPSKILGVPDSYLVMSEIGEATQSIIDAKMREALERFDGIIDYIHISDQFSGPKPSDSDSDTLKPPETSKCLIFGFNLGKKGITTTVDMVNSRKLTQMALYTLEKVKKFRLSREGKAKSEKNRTKAQTAHSKMTHQQRQEASQVRKEEKLKAEKERYMNEDDPEKAIKLKEKYNSKVEKKKQLKGKMMKMKSS